MSLRRQLMRAARGSVLIRLAALALTFAGSVVVARALGPAGFGVYAFVFAIVTLLALPSQVGIPTLLVRETARSRARRKWATMKGLWLWSTRIILSISVAVSVMAAVVLWLLSGHLERELVLTLIAGLVLMPLIALGNARGAALRGLHMVVRGQLPETVIRPLLLLVLVGAAWTLHGEISPPSAMAWHVVSAAVAFGIGAAILWRSRPSEVASGTADLSDAGSWWRAVMPLALISGLQVVSNQAGVVLLGVFRPEAEVGLFKVATSAAALGLFGLQTVILVIQPHIAHMHAVGDRERLQRLASLAALVGAAMTLPVFLVFAFAGRELIAFVYGASYSGAYAPLVVLAFGQLISASFGSVGMLLNMSGHERDAARCLAWSTCANIVIGTALIPVLGMMGAALAVVVSIAIWNVAFWYMAKRNVGVDGSVLPIVARWLRA